MADVELGIFGGSGFYSLADDAEEIVVDTPYGPPSAPVTIVTFDGRRVAFLPRHGREHELPPHRIHFRANLWALRELGVRRMLGPCACGALSSELGLGEFVVCDQLVDRTWGRADTFYDGPDVTHVSAAEPYCPDLRRTLIDAARELDIPVRDGGTVVVIQGPRFSTRAESRWFSGLGWDVDQHDRSYPEGAPRPRARALLRDRRDGHRLRRRASRAHEPVCGTRRWRAVFAENLERLRELLARRRSRRIGPQPDDICSNALRGARFVACCSSALVIHNPARGAARG